MTTRRYNDMLVSLTGHPWQMTFLWVIQVFCLLALPQDRDNYYYLRIISKWWFIDLTSRKVFGGFCFAAKNFYIRQTTAPYNFGLHCHLKASTWALDIRTSSPLIMKDIFSGAAQLSFCVRIISPCLTLYKNVRYVWTSLQVFHEMNPSLITGVSWDESILSVCHGHSSRKRLKKTYPIHKIYLLVSHIMKTYQNNMPVWDQKQST